MVDGDRTCCGFQKRVAKGVGCLLVSLMFAIF